MLRYLVRRLVSGLIVLFLFITLVFFTVQILLPGDFVSQFSLGLSPREAQELRQQLGLDLPMGQRYLQWLWNLVKGDLGRSYSVFDSGPPVIDIIKNVLPATALVFGLGTALAFLLGLWLGMVTGWRGPGLVSGSITFSAITLYTSFPPWLSFLLVYFLVHRLNLLPPAVRGGLFSTPHVSLQVQEVMITMMVGIATIVLVVLGIDYIFHRWARRRIPALVMTALVVGGWAGSWALIGIFPLALEILRKAALAILTFTLLSFGETMLIMRTTMIDTLHEDYVLTARAKGLPEHRVRDRHAARNALLPVISRLVINLPYLFTGVVMIEQVLGWSGVGTTLFFAVGMQNIPLTLGMMLTIGLLSLVARLFLDVLQAALDPRIRSGERFPGLVI